MQASFQIRNKNKLININYTRLQTSDGGFAYAEFGNITKTDSNGNIEWVINVTFPVIFPEPVIVSSLIETSDGALVGLGIGVYKLDPIRDGNIYLTKTEAFLPIPSQTQLPTPIKTPASTVSKPVSTIVILAIASIIIVIVVGVGLLLYARNRKTTN